MLTGLGIITGFALLVSLVASLIMESLARIFGFRGRRMKKTLDTMLGSESEAFLEHPFLKQLYNTPNRENTGPIAPEQLDSDIFGSLVIDNLLNKPNAVDIQTAITQVADPELRELLEYFYRQSNENLESFQEKIEYWFRQVMERATVLYRRRTRTWLFGIGILLAFLANTELLSFRPGFPEGQIIGELLLRGWDFPISQESLSEINWWVKIPSFLLMAVIVACCAPLWFDLYKRLFPASSQISQQRIRLTPPAPRKAVKGLLSENTMPEIVIKVTETFQPILPVVEIVPPKALPAEKKEKIPQALPESSNILFNISDLSKLNWGITQNKIHLDWWRDEKITGKGITIALLGSGFDQLPPDRIKIDPRSKNAPGSSSGLSVLGSKAALIAGGNGNGMYGVAPEANLLLVASDTDERNMTATLLLSDIEFALRSGANIIATLFDLRSITPAERGSLEELSQKASALGCIIVAPIGNMQDKSIVERYPAALSDVVGVGSHDMYGDRSIFSARSNHIRFLAPGENIPTPPIEIAGTSSPKTTSIATAFAAGFFALAQQFVKEKKMNLTAKELCQILERSASPRRAITKGSDVEYGFGILRSQQVLVEMRALVEKKESSDER